MIAKRLGALVLALLLTFTFTACAKQEVEDNPVVENDVTEGGDTVEPDEAAATTMRIGTLKGPTGMGMVEMMSAAKEGTARHDYQFEVVGAPDALVGKIVNGELDIAAVPSNMALLLNNKTEGALQLAAVNTLGVLYVLENGESIDNFNALSGKTLHVSGKGATPDYIIQYLLEANGVTDVTLDYALEHADLAAAMVSGDVTLGLLPQPHVTTTLMKNAEVRSALDITEEWARVQGADNVLPMGVLVVQKAFVEAHPEAFEQFLEDYETSVAFVNDNREEAGVLIESFGILPAAKVAENAIEASNIVFLRAAEARPALDAFYQVLYDFNPKAIGGKLADEGFYYKEKAE